MLHSTILKIFLAIVLLFVLLLLVLSHGVHIRRIDLPGVEISEFYIKLDKKLVVEAESLEIEKRSKEKPEAGDTLRELERIGTLLRFLPVLFEKIQIDRAQVGSERLHMLFYEDVFYIETDRLQLATKLSLPENGRMLYARIRTLYLPGPDVTIRGEFAYDTRSGMWNGEGSYRGLNLDGNFSVWHKDRVIGFDLDSEPTDSIKPLVDYLNPIPPIKEWIYPKIPAKRYVLHRLKGEVTLKRDGSVEFDPDRIFASAAAWDAKVHFHPGVPPVSIPRIDVTYKNNTLFFRLHRPVYEGKKLDGSWVRIRDLVPFRGPAKSQLDAHIVTEAPFDASIHKILEAYGVHVPILQTKGKTKAQTDLTVDLIHIGLLRYRGAYETKKGELLFSGEIPVPVEDLQVTATERSVRIRHGRIRYPKRLDATVTGSIDLRKKRGIFDLALETARFESGGIPLFALKRKRFHVEMRYDPGIRFDIAKLKSRIAYVPGKELRIEVSDLSLFTPYLQGPLSGVKGGSLTFEKGSKENRLSAKVFYPNKILYDRGSPVELFDIVGNARSGTTTLRINRVITATLQKGRTEIVYRDLDIQVLRLRDAILRYLPSRRKAEKREGKEPGFILHIEGNDTRIMTRYAELPCDTATAKITTDPFSVLFESRHGDGTIHAIVLGDDLKIVGKRLPDRVVQGVPALKNLKGGYYDFDAVGTTEDFNGTILMHDALWASGAVYNNVLATLNTIPALLTLQNPGFDKEGFKIREGVIRYRYRKPIFHFQEIAIRGKSANIYGKGRIDFDKRSIDVRMRIKFLKGFSGTVQKIPAVGYILLGDDGSVSVGLSVTGSLSDPKVETSAAKDIVTAPFNILKRTLTFPFRLFK